MPQMMPMNWIIMFSMFIMIIILMMIFNFYNLQYSTNQSQLKYLFPSLKWKW